LIFQILVWLSKKEKLYVPVNKKAHPINQMSYYILSERSLKINRYLTYLSPFQTRLELAPFPVILNDEWEVVKASSGHIPQPFLIRNLKNCSKDREYRTGNNELRISKWRRMLNEELRIVQE